MVSTCDVKWCINFNYHYIVGLHLTHKISKLVVLSKTSSVISVRRFSLRSLKEAEKKSYFRYSSLLVQNYSRPSEISTKGTPGLTYKEWSWESPPKTSLLSSFRKLLLSLLFKRKQSVKNQTEHSLNWYECPIIKISPFTGLNYKLT